MIWPLKKRTLKQRKLGERKKYLNKLVARLAERKAIVELELEKITRELEKARRDLELTIKRGVDGV